MLFNSILFISIFLPASLLVFNLMERRVGRVPALLSMCAASLVFYVNWNARYLLVLLLSIGVNFAVALVMERQADDRARRAVLVAAIGGNLSLLVYFKYWPYILGVLGVDVAGSDSWFWRVHLLPLGISFWTFQQIIFLIERYDRGSKQLGFLEYFSIVSFFPHLIAGPIVRTSELGPQVKVVGSRERDCWQDAAVGMALFTAGLCKKTLIADRLAVIPDAVFNSTLGPSVWSAWLGATTYTLQLYFDFSGYCDMGIGLARMYGFEFPVNFASPLMSRSFVEFWRRWHITLTRFFTDTIYTPMAMGLSRRLADWDRPTLRYLVTVSIPIFITFLLTGIWHGAGNQFVVFGILNGLFMAIGVSIPRRSVRLPDSVSTLLTFSLVSMVLVFFRAPDLHAALVVVGQMLSLPHSGELARLGRWVSGQRVAVVSLVVAWPLALRGGDLYDLMASVHRPIGVRPRSLGAAPLVFRLNPLWGSIVGLGLSLCILQLTLEQVHTFVYFQF